MDNWFAQSLRLTVFTPIPNPDLEALWGLISETAPESEESRPKDAYRRLTGFLGDGDVQVLVQSLPGRLDVIESPVAGPGLPPSTHLGEADGVVEQFAQICLKLIPQIAELGIPVTRLAFGISLLRSAEDRIAGYRMLQDLVPVVLDPENSRDFIYQINRPSNFTLGDETFELNRLSRWACVIHQLFNIQGAVGGSPAAPTGYFEPKSFVQVEIDNSTSASNTKPIESSYLIPIFNQLLDLAEESSRGDRK